MPCTVLARSGSHGASLAWKTPFSVQPLCKDPELHALCLLLHSPPAGPRLHHDLQYLTAPLVVDGERARLPGDAGAQLQPGARGPSRHHGQRLPARLPVHRGGEQRHADLPGGEHCSFPPHPQSQITEWEKGVAAGTGVGRAGAVPVCHRASVPVYSTESNEPMTAPWGAAHPKACQAVGWVLQGLGSSQCNPHRGVAGGCAAWHRGWSLHLSGCLIPWGGGKGTHLDPKLLWSLGGCRETKERELGHRAAAMHPSSAAWGSAPILCHHPCPHSAAETIQPCCIPNQHPLEVGSSTTSPEKALILPRMLSVPLGCSRHPLAAAGSLLVHCPSPQ